MERQENRVARDVRSTHQGVRDAAVAYEGRIELEVERSIA
jgi:hypothetical protein